MRTCLVFLKRQFWPLSALVFGPWFGALLLSWTLQLTTGSRAGESIREHYDTLRVILVSLFSLYSMLAFLLWTVGRPAPDPEAPAPLLKAAPGLSLGQIMGWGLFGMLLMPAVVALSTIHHQTSIVDAFTRAFHIDPAMHVGFLWLLSISTFIMTPIMVVWLVWMWRTWATHRASQDAVDTWDYDYE